MGGSSSKNNYVSCFDCDFSKMLEIEHKNWKDSIVVKNNMFFHRFNNNSETGYLIIINDTLYLFWDNWGIEKSLKDFKIIKGVENIINLKTFQDKSIFERISFNHDVNPYNLFLINLEHRKDRKEDFINSTPKGIFNINIFNAVKNKKGHRGCLLSHFSLILYAKHNKLPYIIVAEDDAIFKVDKNKILKVLQLLEENLTKWDIFNGSPTFGSMKEELTLINSFDELFINSSWGQSTAFMIYNSSIYDEIINECLFNDPIDLYLSKNFIQTIYKNEPFVIQKASYSDIEKKSQEKNYEIFFEEQYKIINKNLPKKNTNIHNDFFMGILNCEKYSFKRDKQNHSGNIFDYRYFVGNPELNTCFEDHDKKVVYLPCKDDYESLTNKVYHMVKWILDNRPDIKYIIKTDDDVNFNYKNLISTCLNIKEKNLDYAGHVINFKEDYYSDYHCNKDGVTNTQKIKLEKGSFCKGVCYFLSLKSAKIISENLLTNFNIFEDYSVSRCLKSHNIYPTNIKLINHVCTFEGQD